MHQCLSNSPVALQLIEQIHTLQTMHADVCRYPSGFWNTSKIPMERAFPSPRWSKKALQIELNPWLIQSLTYPPKWVLWPTFQLYLSYKSIRSASASLQPAEKGSLAVVQISNLVQLFLCKACHVYFFSDPFSWGCITESISTCSKQAFDISKLLPHSGQLLLTLSLLKGKRPKVSQFSSETHDAEHTR